MHQDNATKTVSQSKRSSSLPAFLNVRQPKDLLAKQNIKTLLQWFKAWRVWQRRILICQVIEQCSVEGLESLATALEPTLHLDFSTTLAPPIAALHLDGAAMFQVQRRCLANSQSQEQEPSFDCLSTVPTTLLASSNSQESRAVDSPTYRKRTAILPAIPLTHVRHATLSATTELEDSVALRRQRFSSVPNFQSTSSLLRQVRVSNGRKTRHRRTRSLDEVGGRKGMSSRAAIFRTQMKHASQVQSFSHFKLINVCFCVCCVRVYIMCVCVYVVDGEMGCTTKTLIHFGVSEILRQGSTWIPCSMPLPAVW